LAPLSTSRAALAGDLPTPVVHPLLWNAATNQPGTDEAPGLGTSFTASSSVFDSDAPEDAFGNQDGPTEPDTFIFGDTGTVDDGNATLGDGGETVDFLEWQTTSSTTVLGYELVLTQLDPFGRETELVRFLVDGVERDFFDNDSATGIDNSTINHVLRPFGQFVTGSTFRIEVTRGSALGPRITEINALTESFCGNETVEGDEECDDGNQDDGDGCSAACLVEEGCPSAPDESCIAAAKASLSIQEKTAGKEKLAAKLQAFASATAQADFGDPVAGATRYDVCVYDAKGALVASLGVARAGQTCGPADKPCWKDARGKGWSYKDPDAAASGVRKLAAVGGPAGKGKLQVQAGNNAAKGQTALPTGLAVALQGATAATLQVGASDAQCFRASLGTVVKADSVQFKAKAP
jgi:cysteine-rich repeat protein